MGTTRARNPAPTAWGYVGGSAGTGSTYNANLAAFKRVALVPSRLVSFKVPDMSVTLFGKQQKSPILLAPVGVLSIFHRDKELAVAAAARNNHVPYILSSAASSSIEEVAAANGDGERWYQLYWPSNENNDITISLLKRAKDSGFRVLVVTLDTYILGWRPSDLECAYNPFLQPDHVGVEIGFTDPVFRQKYKNYHGKEVEEDIGAAARTWAETIFPGKSHSWEDLAFLQQHWDGPIVLKGIQTIADAKKAAELGIQGIVVSNHGGRQVDGCIASLDVLKEIADLNLNMSILFDSGIRNGSDIVKALALGAQGVLVGRPWVYGLSIAGQGGVEHVIKSLLGELDLTLQLSGIPSIRPKHLNSDSLRRVKD